VCRIEFVTRRHGTTHRYFTQAELRDYIETELGTEALPAAPGVFYVFRDQELRERFIASRYRRRQSVPRKRISEIRFEENKDILEPLIAAITDLGRLPHADEFELAEEVIERFGSLKRAFALIRRVTGVEEWEKIRQCRTEDLTVYLALARFGLRPPISKLPLALQRDIREFFRTYKRACQTADELLFRAGDPEAIDDACKRSRIGKLLPNALYVHRSALETLEPLLRVYEGCARAYLGEIEDMNIVKYTGFPARCPIWPIRISTPIRIRRWCARSNCHSDRSHWHATTTRKATTRRSCIAKKRFSPPIIHSAKDSLGSLGRKTNTACWTMR
jgi:DNA phosphorothioation-associated putative methyltransferase